MRNKKVSVVVVDDDADIRAVMRLCLEEIGFRVQEAPDGRAALSLLQMSKQPCIVVLDNNMPTLSGEGVLEAVQANSHLRSFHRYIFCSARSLANSRHLRELITSLHLPTLKKPFDLQDLYTLVGNAAKQLA